MAAARSHEAGWFAAPDRLIHEPARLTIMANLSVVESADATWLVQQTDLTWGNLSSHLVKLRDAGYVTVVKGYAGNKPQTTLALSDKGRAAFREYRERLTRALADLPN